MRSFFHKSIVLFLLTGLVVSCADKERPNYQFMSNTDMYEPIGYEAYGEYDIFPGGQSAMDPVEGTVARGWKPYEYENTPDGSSQAKTELENPLPYTEEHLTEGKELYTIYCAVCHGDAGDGQGILAEREKILGVPSYDDVGRAITEGSVYHVIYYGLNSMGSYASQIDEKERWQITHYVMNLKDQLEGNPEREYEEVGPTVSPDDPDVQAAQENVGEGTVLTEEESNN
ncbi:MAG: cytochrome c [Salegentibacter sp.]|uniref:Quinol:cytochrome c oxidoreductase monoheme cytochrome subunit n=1 Tax=Salegentibacter flavus TaxID=287099 RepID=A0A1I4XMH3_9FLAO|nr:MULTISPECIES: cytochrome c [Salegentibacter]MDR9456027.1 cytochrome c [Salegentibacter sp.]SFN26846.1 quinol:cytochrome c oxidoreductase monoheme cytochrome subunit [Salegentibacter flavus]